MNIHSLLLCDLTGKLTMLCAQRNNCLQMYACVNTHIPYLLCTPFFPTEGSQSLGHTNKEMFRHIRMTIELKSMHLDMQHSQIAKHMRAHTNNSLCIDVMLLVQSERHPPELHDRGCALSRSGILLLPTRTAVQTCVLDSCLYSVDG